MTPEFVYFDLGNVLLHFDYEIACRNIANLVDRTPDEVRRVVFEGTLQNDYETGSIDDLGFHQAFCAELECQCDLQKLKIAASDIFQLNTSIVPLVCNLQRSGCRLGILSNTCSAHWEFIANGRYAILPELFEQTALSFEIGSMKPSPEIYAAAQEMAQVPADSIVFMDDRVENVEGAQRAGFRATLYTGPNELRKILASEGLPL